MEKTKVKKHKKPSKWSIRNYEKYSKSHILWSTFFWIIGVILIFLIWWVLSATLNKGKFVFPTIGDTFTGIGKILSNSSLSYIGQQAGLKIPASQLNQEWAAIGIAVGETAMCFVCAFIIVSLCVYLAHLFKPLKWLFSPFVTYTRTLPTAVIMCMITLLFAPESASVWLIPIIVSFCILFPVLYNAVQNACDQVNRKKLEVGYIYGMGKWQIFTKIMLRQMTPYIFNSMITGFGLTFKVVIASQLVSIAILPNPITPSYPSIGQMMGIAINSLNKVSGSATNTISGIILGWGIIAIVISLIFELSFKGISWVCMPWRHKKYHSPEQKAQIQTGGK